MSTTGTTFANTILDNICRNESMPPVTQTNAWVSLHTGDSGANG